LKKYNLSRSDLARAVDVSTAAVHQWFDGKRPTEAHRQSIEIWTNGEVRADWWLTDAECARIARVVRFQPTANDTPAPAASRHTRRHSAAASQR
jgi:DNA-binding XRE family transcriptional regulator